MELQYIILVHHIAFHIHLAIVKKCILIYAWIVKVSLFFSTKEYVNMNSYKTDNISGLPVLYLQDHKKHYGINFMNNIQMECKEHLLW